MVKCTVCDKQIPDGATHCSVNCLTESRMKGAIQSVKSDMAFGKSMKDMVTKEPEKLVKPTMVIVTHRRKRNKVDVVGTTVFSFNDKCEARIPYVGHVLSDIEALIRASGGVASYRFEHEVTLPTESITVTEEVSNSEDSAVPVVDEQPVLEEPIVAVELQPTIEEPVDTEEDVISSSMIEAPVRKPVRSKKRTLKENEDGDS